MTILSPKVKNICDTNRHWIIHENEEWIFLNNEYIDYYWLCHKPIFGIKIAHSNNQKAIYRYSKYELNCKAELHEVEGLILSFSLFIFFPMLCVMNIMAPSLIATTIAVGGLALFNCLMFLPTIRLPNMYKSWECVHYLEQHLSQPGMDSANRTLLIRNNGWMTEQQIALFNGDIPCSEIQDWDATSHSEITIGHIGVMKNDPNIVTEYLKNTMTKNAFDLVKTAISIAHFDCALAIIKHQPDLQYDHRLYTALNAGSHLQFQGKALEARKTLRQMIIPAANILTVNATLFEAPLSDVPDWKKNTTIATKITKVDVLASIPS